MGKASRAKGLRRENQMVKRHIEAGVFAERVPLSGAARYQNNGGDIDLYCFGRDKAPLVGEVKARANGEGFATIERWLADNDFLALQRDRAAPLFVVPWRVWVRLIGGYDAKLDGAQCYEVALEGMRERLKS